LQRLIHSVKDTKGMGLFILKVFGGFPDDQKNGF